MAANAENSAAQSALSEKSPVTTSEKDAPGGKPVPTIEDPSSEERVQWVSWLRSVAPYVHKHHGATFVVSFDGRVADNPKLLNRLVMDASLIASLGVRLVLVHGARPQIEELMHLRGLLEHYYKGVRITDAADLECVKEACGEIRFDIEAAFSQGLPNTPMQHSKMRVVSGNFVTAKPLGVIDGIDFQHTGVVRKVDAESIEAALDRGFLVIASPFGFSPTGEAFNLTTEDVATSIACAIGADKLIFMVGEPGVQPEGHFEPELSITQAKTLKAQGKLNEEDAYNLSYAIRAIEGGVDRVHFIPFHVDGSLLCELFTHDGLGTMVTEEQMESMREATADDVGGLLKLLEPFEANGTLVKRSREKLEREITRFTILEHDGIIYGSAALYPYPEAHIGEMAAFTVHPDYQGAGDGQRLLKRIEQRARALGLTRIFVLTTRTSHWFLRHGFEPATIENLPVEKQKMYNWNRKSLIFVKKLS